MRSTKAAPNRHGSGLLSYLIYLLFTPGSARGAVQPDLPGAEALDRLGQELPLGVREHAALERREIVVGEHGHGLLQQHRADAAVFIRKVSRRPRDLQAAGEHRLVHRVAAQRLERRNERRLHRDDLAAEALCRLAADAGVKARVDHKLNVHILELVADGHVVRRVVRKHARLDDDGLDAGIARALERVGARVGRDDGDELQLRDLAEEHGIEQALQFCSLAGNQNSTADHKQFTPSPAAGRLWRGYYPPAG